MRLFYFNQSLEWWFKNSTLYPNNNYYKAAVMSVGVQSHKGTKPISMKFHKTWPLNLGVTLVYFRLNIFSHFKMAAF